MKKKQIKKKAWALLYKGNIQDIFLHKESVDMFLGSPAGMLAVHFIKQHEIVEIEITYKQ